MVQPQMNKRRSHQSPKRSAAILCGDPKDLANIVTSLEGYTKNISKVQRHMHDALDTFHATNFSAASVYETFIAYMLQLQK